MKRIVLFSLILAVVSLSVSCSENGKVSPRVVGTIPENGDVAVDPAVTELTVIFNEEMADQSWSWVYEDKNTFPTTTGQAYYADDFTRNIPPGCRFCL